MRRKTGRLRGVRGGNYNAPSIKRGAAARFAVESVQPAFQILSQQSEIPDAKSPA
jgi:aryl-alcohol dehydrogenase-like predicted oxidoreductase